MQKYSIQVREPYSQLPARLFIAFILALLLIVPIAANLLISAVLAAESSPPTPFVKRITRSPENTYFTYPHSNGFLKDGKAVVARPTKDDSGPGVDYFACNLKTGESSKIAHVNEARWYYAIAHSGKMAVPVKGGIVLVDLEHGGQTSLFNDPHWSVAADIDISKDGKKVLATMQRGGEAKAFRTAVFDCESGAMTTITKEWATDHAHFSPYDESWICYCDNRQPNHDRMWVWNASEAPKGRHIFNQQMRDKKWLAVGHERAMFTKPALLTVAFGMSEGTPRGLYEVGFDGNVRLVSEGNSDFHCNVSHDGRWAVVTSEGAIANENGNLDLLHRPTRGWFEAAGNFGYSDVMLVNLKTGARQFLYRGTNDKNHQPYEVQPSISPDDRWVLIKDAREKRVLCLEIDQTALKSFLR